MAKKLLSLTFLLSSFLIFGQITLIPDSNFEQALIDLSIDSDGIVNGEVATSDITSITSLNLKNKNIQDLTGIEGFTALEVLDVRSNQLTELDISNNLELITLKCGANSISRLDLTNNNKLVNLVAESNNITRIIPNILPASLQAINLAGNEMSSLDLSNLTSLGALWLSDCSNLQYLNVKNGNNSSITNAGNFDIRTNPLLDCVMVDDPGFSDTYWTNKDAHSSFNTSCEDYVYIPDDNFEQALIDLGYDTDLDNSILRSNISAVTALDVDQKNISDLTGIEAFTALQSLRVRGNSLTELDLYNNTELNTLYADYNALSTLDLSTNTKLRKLAVVGNGMDELIISDLAIDLYEFNVSNNNFKAFDLSNFFNLLMVIVSDNPYLEKFSLKNGNNSSILIFQASNNPLLYCIDVDDASYSEANWTNIDAHTNFSENCFNTYTYVPDDNFEQALIDLGYDDVLDNYVLTANIESVTILNVYNKNISALTGIERFTALKDLDCRVNNLSDLDVSNNTELTDLLCGNNNITKLDISNNTKLIYFAAEGNGLTELLPLSLPTSIFSLNLNDNNLVSLNLSGMTSLKHLHLRDNPYLEALTLKNIDKTVISTFETINTPNLYCIEVDDPDYSTTNWLDIDGHTSFNTDCIAPIITLIGANPQIIDLGAGYSELGASTDDGSVVVIDDSEFLDEVGTYTIYYNATDASGNSATQVTRTVKVEDNSLSSEDHEKLQLSIYPNPTTGKVFFSQELNSIKLFNISGQKVKQGLGQEMDLKDLPSGIYFGHLTNQEGTTVVKIIKQ